MNIEKLKKYIDKFGEVSRVDLEKIRYFDEELASQVEMILSLSHHTYDNQISRISKIKDNESFVKDTYYCVYANMFSLSYEVSLENYIQKCVKNKDGAKKTIELGY